MISEPLKFSPDETHLRYAKEREEYTRRLKSYQVGEETPRVREEKLPEPRERKSNAFQATDLVLIGAILLLLTDGVQPQDTVLLGILIYLLLG